MSIISRIVLGEDTPPPAHSARCGKYSLKHIESKCSSLESLGGVHAGGGMVVILLEWRPHWFRSVRHARFCFLFTTAVERMWHIRQSRRDSGLGLQVKFLKSYSICSLLARQRTGVHLGPAAEQVPVSAYGGSLKNLKDLWPAATSCLHATSLRGRPAGGRATHEHVHGSRLIH